MSATAKITGKGQVTIPAAVRKSLHLETGDTLLWQTDADGRLWVRRLEPLDLEYLAAVSRTLSEWDSPEDEAAYGNL
ncbi:MAG: AbrB/MazE/SpoVT family DNA-binding domain-containing protein [Candidatus Moranbacteria bacterium]|nr:AbrB/MazE/SpoVT family DNA-binding domain-containing protein [Candidatus Moranbacteria bacterium]